MITPRPFQHLRLAASPEERTAADEQATQNLLTAYQNETGYTCPFCKHKYTDPEHFLEHIITEANQLFDQLQNTTLLNTPTREETK